MGLYEPFRGLVLFLPLLALQLLLYPHVLALIYANTATPSTVQQAGDDWWTGTITILPDGSIDPLDAPVVIEGSIYRLVKNVKSCGDGIIVQRDNVIIDGAGHVIEGPGSEAYPCKGVNLAERVNVTVKNLKIQNFYDGVYFEKSSNNVIFNNSIVNNYFGVSFIESSNNVIIANNIAENSECGIYLNHSPNNTIANNTVAKSEYGIAIKGSLNNTVIKNNVIGNNETGILLQESLNNIVAENNITGSSRCGVCLYGSSNNVIANNSIANNRYGVYLEYSSNNVIINNSVVRSNETGIILKSSLNNVIYHNSFIDNAVQVYSQYSVNIWDAGYPTGGNYWSDYRGGDQYSGPTQEELGSDGIGDKPYKIDEYNIDRYPLVKEAGVAIKESPTLTLTYPYIIGVSIAAVVAILAVFILKMRR